MNTATHERSEPSRIRYAYAISILGFVLFLSVIGLGAAAGRNKLVAITVFAFVAMMLGVGTRFVGEFTTPKRQVWAYGLSSGAMLASATALLAPKAIGQHPEIGGFAIAFGYLLGYAAHELEYLFTHMEMPVNAATSELTIHAIAAGSIMGVVYGTLPSLTPLFGYGIVAHKFPAGFTGAEAVKRAGLPLSVMILPAAAVAIAAIPMSILTPDLSPIVKASFYGISTGVFTHVAIDMLPECSHVGSHSDAATTGHGVVHCSPDVDALRQHAVLSTVVGAAVILSMWYLFTMA
ncbi:MAG: ZIP family metal transporter [Halodesulfurarchaeum sp.]